MSVNSLSAQCMLQQFFRLSVRAVKSNTFHHVLTGNWRPAKSTMQEIHTSKMHHIPTRCQAVTTSDLHRWATIRKPAHLPCRRRRPHHRLDQVLTTLRSSTMTSTNNLLVYATWYLLFSLPCGVQQPIKLPSAEASKRSQCTSPGYTLHKGNNENSLELNTN